jgi:phosphatidylserine/phosphatidylglycerophosphate/cardiolipin synthase-like enzyme
MRERVFGSNRTPEAIKQANIPGLKVHVATLVAPDTPAGQEWQEVYIHAKLMLIDDAFMTLGSTNINNRSMQVDSELNIAHHRPEITAPLRMQQWEKYTGGQVTGGMELAKSFEAWEKVMVRNVNAKKLSRLPVAQLAEFLRTSDKMNRTGFRGGLLA